MTTWFEEVQRLRDNRWMWPALVAVTLIIFLPLTDAVITQLVRGERWGNEPLSDQGLVLLVLFVTTCWALVCFMLITMTLETRIGSKGIHYRFYPLKPRWQLIHPSEINEYVVAKKFRLFESGGIGHHTNILKKTRSFRIYGGSHLSVRLKNGGKVLLGTQNRESMEWAMKKLLGEKANN